MTINLKTIQDISKLLAFIRGRTGGEFRIDPALLQEALRQLDAFAKAHGIRYRLTTPSEERAVIYTAAGIVAGAAAGYALASVPGAVLGGVAGGFAGYFCAHVKLYVADRGDGTFGITLQPA